MLVKLGDIWVDPTKIETIYFEPDSDSIGFDTEKRSYLTAKGDWRVDDLAAIINNITGQTYGGSEDEAPKENI